MLFIFKRPDILGGDRSCQMARFIFLVILMLGLGDMAATQTISISSNSSIQVQVCQVPITGAQQRYFYRISSSTALPISSLWVGYDAHTELFEFTVPLLGFDARGNYDEDQLIAQNTTSPPGWKAAMVSDEEQSKTGLEWSLSDEDANPPEMRVLNGFSVVTPADDPVHAKAHWKVTAADGTVSTGALSPISKIVPRISVSLSPGTVQANSSMVRVTAAIVANDATGQAPSVHLVSITANETINRSTDITAQTGTDTRSFSLMAATNGTAPRVYTVSYSATNYCGYSQIAAATITVQPASR